jgi:hydroxymethylpyrimidine/phosphomethylpyrimidine kinase
MATAPPVVLSIAGFDPCSGAGVTADIKTMVAHDCYGVTCITALTVQSTAGVRRVQPVAPEMVQQTLEELARDMPIAAVHIGMLGEEGVVGVVADFLAESRLRNVVLDPVLKSSSGADLLEARAVGSFLEKLLPLADVVTPNVDEAAALTGLAVTNIEQMKAAAGRLHEMGARAVVITGGHLDPAADVLSFHGAAGWESCIFESRRLASGSTHGTGCAFSTALACNLARGRGLAEAVKCAKDYVNGAIGGGYSLGKGIGPVNHMYERKT